MALLLLALVSCLAWVISSLAGGGSPFIIMPLANVLLETSAIAPVMTIGMLLGNLHRTCQFWQQIDRPLTWWYLTGALPGAVLGAFVFTKIQLEWVQVLLGLFLVSYVFNFGCSDRESSFRVRGWFFLPAGFVHAFLSGLIGSVGPLLNPLYLNYGLVKEKMIATKAVHVVVVHVVKLITYAAFGALKWRYLGYGLAIGMAAIPGNWLGQLLLQQISDRKFRQLAVAVVTLSGVVMLWNQRDFFVFWRST
ncbi:MAG: sulfite exporter TauE/SafE family protein [Cyanosarcina radialis HA8281-LM2]|nr:sulfite exporter TauE/SafE family protein [Cyanosarcina radialis HA8281-LM2]